MNKLIQAVLAMAIGVVFITIISNIISGMSGEITRQETHIVTEEAPW